MKKGFAAHLILTSDRRIKSAIVLIDEKGYLSEICVLNRETPFTRFYDGALLLLRANATPTEPGLSPEKGDPVSIWQFYPYDLVQGVELPHTRCLRIH